MTRSPEAQAILDEMKPLGEWLMEHRPLTRVLGRTQYAKEHGYEALKQIDAEWEKKNTRFNQLQNKYRAIRKKEMKFL